MTRKSLPAVVNRYAGKLSDEQKVYVVRRLATYDTANAIARDLQELGVRIAPQSVERYHPESAAGAGLAERWKDLFRETRKAYILAAADIGANDKAVRMRLREDIALKARDAGQYGTANQILDSIAKESGGAFESKHRLAQVASQIPLTATITYTGPPEPMPAFKAEDRGEPVTAALPPPRSRPPGRGLTGPAAAG